uniref:Uncharacterized protein n=1 Tax=Arundo donax TaxID=35708 RepID=A0A0A9B0N1_ARUDO
MPRRAARRRRRPRRTARRSCRPRTGACCWARGGRRPC